LIAASASAAGDLLFWRTDDAAIIHSVSELGGVATEVVWSQDGKYLAVGVGIGGATLNGNGDVMSVGDGKAKVLLLDGVHLATLAVTALLPALVSALSFDPAGQTLAVGLFVQFRTIDTAALLYAIPTLELRGRMDPHGQKVKQLLFSPCGRFLVSNSEQELYAETEDENARNEYTPKARPWVQIWHAGSGELALPLLGHTRVVHHASFRPDGNQVLTAGADGSARIWDIETGTELRRLFRQEQHVYRAAFSDDGRRVATKTDDEAVRVWAADNGALVRELTDQREEFWLGMAEKVARAQAFFFCDDDRMLCSLSDLKVPRLTDTAKSPLIAEHWHHSGAVFAARFTPDGSRIVSIGRSKELVCFDVKTGAIISRGYLTYSSLTYREDNLSFLGAGQYLAVITDDLRSYSDDVAVQCFDLADGEEVFHARLKDGHDERIVISRDPPGIAAFVQSEVTTWAPSEAERSELTTRLPAAPIRRDLGLDGRPTRVAGGRLAISVTRQGDFAVQEVSTGRQVAMIPSKFGIVDGVRQAHGCHVQEAPAEGLVALIEYDEERIAARFIDFAGSTHEEMMCLRPRERYGDGFNWLLDPTGRFALCIVKKGRLGAPAAGIHDARTGALLIELPHPDLVVDAQFNPTEPQIVTASSDGGTRIWDFARSYAAQGLSPGEVLGRALDFGIGSVTKNDRKLPLLKVAPQNLWEALPRSLTAGDQLRSPRLEPRSHPSCYALERDDQNLPPTAWSPFIENRRKQALPVPSFDDSTAGLDERAFRRTSIFQLADALTKAALTVHMASSQSAQIPSDTADRDRLSRIDELLEHAASLAADLHYCVRRRTAAQDGKEQGFLPDALAHDPELPRRGVRGVLDESSQIEFDRTALEDVAGRYLRGRYRADEFDVVLTRALTGLEMFQFAHSLRLKDEFGLSKSTQVGLIFGIALLMLAAIAGIGFGLRWVIRGAHEANLLGEWANSLADILAGAFALLAVQTLWGIPVSIAKKHVGKPAGYDILEKMFHA